MDSTMAVAVITAVGAIVISVTTLILGHLRDMRNTDTLNRIEETGIATHKAGNSTLLEAQRLHAVAREQLVILKPTPENIQLAEAAQRTVREHEEREGVKGTKE